MNNYPEKEPIISALFVDFDNIFISLNQQNKHFATQFAVNPDRWLRWLEQSAMGNARRRILVRRCYLNPQSFAEFRPFFIRSAFEVVDCPPLTAHGKTSTDIHLVMDVLDTLNHPTNFREFIILSGDSDFTPVLLRLRMNNRWTTIFSGGNNISPAYKASCDTLITEDEFVRDGLGISFQEDEPSEPVITNPQVSNSVLEKIASRLYEAAVESQGIEASELPKILSEFPDFRKGSQWLGYQSLRGLTEAIVRLRTDLYISGEDPWRLCRKEESTNLDERNESMKKSIAQWIRSIIAASPTGVAMASLADGVVQKFGIEIRNSNWLGEKSFKGLLMKLDLGDLQLNAYGPGYVYHPKFHKMPGMESNGGDTDEGGEKNSLVPPVGDFSLKFPHLAPLAWKINQLTDTPYLLPDHYTLIFNEIAREIDENANFHVIRTSKTVRDRCVEKGAPVARSHVNFILTGLNVSGYPLGKEIPVDTANLAAKMRENTQNLCRNVQFLLTENENTLLNEWMKA